MTHPNILDQFPSSARIIADVIGPQATLALAEKCYERAQSPSHCNVNLYIPKKIPRGHWLTACVGLKLSTRLQESFGGESFPFPKCRSVQCSNRNRQILNLYHSGKTIEQIRERFKISTSTLKRIIHPEIADDNREKTKQRMRKSKNYVILVSKEEKLPMNRGVVGSF